MDGSCTTFCLGRAPSAIAGLTTDVGAAAIALPDCHYTYPLPPTTTSSTTTFPLSRHTFASTWCSTFLLRHQPVLPRQQLPHQQAAGGAAADDGMGVGSGGGGEGEAPPTAPSELWLKGWPPPRAVQPQPRTAVANTAVPSDKFPWTRLGCTFATTPGPQEHQLAAVLSGGAGPPVIAVGWGRCYVGSGRTLLLWRSIQPGALPAAVQPTEAALLPEGATLLAVATHASSDAGSQDLAIAISTAGQAYVLRGNGNGNGSGERERVLGFDLIDRPFGLLQVKVVAVACGNGHTILLSNINGVSTFGKGGHGQLGHGDAASLPAASPMVVEALHGIQIVRVCAGAWHSVAVSRDGDVYTWG